MDFKHIKDFLESEPGKVLVLEDGEPRLIIMPYKDYQRMKSEHYKSSTSSEEEDNPRSEQEITLDDLPV